MPIPSSGPIKFSEIQNEFGGSDPIGLTEYYAGGSFVGSGTLGFPGGTGTPIPSSGSLSLGGFYGASLPGLTWNGLYKTTVTYGSQNPSIGPGTTRSNVIYTNGKFFVPTRFSILSSTDAINWTESTLPIPSGSFAFGVSDITWTGSQYVAVGVDLISTTSTTYGYKNIATSPDGVTWTLRTTPNNAVMNSVATNGSIILAAGDIPNVAGVSGLISSTDGINWSYVQNLPTSGYRFTGIKWNGFQFLVQASLGSTEYFFTSSNGTTWSNATVPWQGDYNARYFNELTWSGSNWVASTQSGYLFVSSNGVSWTRTYTQSTSTTQYFYPRVVWDGSKFTSYMSNYVVSNGQRYNTTATSTNGSSWTTSTFVYNTNQLTGAAYGNGKYVLADTSGISYSTDGINFTKVNAGFSREWSLSSMAFNGTTLVAVGTSSYNLPISSPATIYPTIVSSSDKGYSWTREINFNSLASPWQYSDVIWDGAKFIVAGSGGYIATRNASGIWTNTNTANLTSPSSTGKLSSLSSSGTVVCSSSHRASSQYYYLASSNGGTSWTAYLAPATAGYAAGILEYRAIANNGTYIFMFLNVFSGTFNSIPRVALVRSTNGVNWTDLHGTATLPTQLPTNSNKNIVGMKYLNNTFIAYGFLGNASVPDTPFIIRSSDGITWTATTLTGAGKEGIVDVAYLNGRYIAISNFLDTNSKIINSYIYNSSDGITWTRNTDFTKTKLLNTWPTSVTSATSTDSSFIVGGTPGMISMSPGPTTSFL